jgi:oligoendopeptidase F
MASRTVRIHRRHEIPVSDTWDLGQLFRAEEDYQRVLDRVRARYTQYPEFKGYLGRSAVRLADYLEFDASIDRDLEKLTHYASLKKAEDASEPANVARWAELRNLGTRVAESRAFAVPEIQSLTDDQFAELIKDPLLEPWQIYLQRLRRNLSHTLSPGEERLLSLAGSALSGYKEIFSQLTNLDMKFGRLTTNHGERIELTPGLADSLLTNLDRGTRRRAFHKLYRQIENHQFTLASALAASVRVDVFYARSRGYASALAAALFPDNIPVAVYHNLVASVRCYLPLVHQYYALRRQTFARGKLYYYDTFVRIAPDIYVHTRFDEAIGLVCQALAPLGKEYVQALRKGINARWVDRYETPGKRPGSFSSSSYRNPPFILMNYRPATISSVFTVAHEAGHSMHTWLSQSCQPFRYYKPSALLAEVAAMVNEELLTDFWLNRTTEPNVRAFLIDRSLERLRSVLVHQTMLAEFERIIHETEESGSALTLEFFRQTYGGLLKQYLGSEIAIDPELELECLRIPHFYSAFYVYRYALGISAAMMLATKIKKGDAESRRRYLELLRAGRTKFPIDALLAVDVDLRGPEPVAYTMEVFAERLDRLRELVAGFGKSRTAQTSPRLVKPRIRSGKGKVRGDQ